MKLLLPVVVASTMLTIVTSPTFADDNGNHFGWYKDNGNPHGYSGVPGPIAGAGLPVLAIGYGVYWLVKRRRKDRS